MQINGVDTYNSVHAQLHTHDDDGKFLSSPSRIMHIPEFCGFASEDTIRNQLVRYHNLCKVQVKCRATIKPVDVREQ